MDPDVQTVRTRNTNTLKTNTSVSSADHPRTVAGVQIAQPANIDMVTAQTSVFGAVRPLRVAVAQTARYAPTKSSNTRWDELYNLTRLSQL